MFVGSFILVRMAGHGGWSIGTDGGCTMGTATGKRRRRKRISPVRKLMIQDMQLAGLSPRTQETYLSAIVGLVKHYDNKRPELMTEREVYRYIIWLRDEKGVARGTFYSRFWGMKLLFHRTLDQNWALFTKKRFVRPSKSLCRLCSPDRNAAA